MVRLRAKAQDCNISCPDCQHDISESYIKDQFRGFQNEMFQTDRLAKTESLTTLDQIIKHSEAFEAALWDQLQLVDVTDVADAMLLTYAK